MPIQPSYDTIHILDPGTMLCVEYSNDSDGASSFKLATKIDNRLSKDNLILYQVVKLWNDECTVCNGYTEVSLGDIIISYYVGDDVWFVGDPTKYKMFKLEHIAGKIHT